MDSFEVRKQLGNQLINQLIADGITDSFKQAIILWRDGYSLRVIQDLTDIHRSKLSRYINEHDLTRDDDVRSQNRKDLCGQERDKRVAHCRWQADRPHDGEASAKRSVRQVFGRRGLSRQNSVYAIFALYNKSDVLRS